MLIRTALAPLLISLLLAGCGVRGSLEPPSARDASPAEADVPVAPEDDRPFILDGLLL
ncbi:MAG: lipoprotein [Pseudomonadota bacterium]